MSKCDKCDKPATVHLTEISGGQKIEKHLCEDCAVAEGITSKSGLPISQLLEDFILQAQEGPDVSELACDVCGMTVGEFRRNGLLGCPHDYEAFEKVLIPLLSRAHEGATQHIGKVPNRAGSDQKKQVAMLRLRSQLNNAIAAEDYERAAMLRDQIKEMEDA